MTIAKFLLTIAYFYVLYRHWKAFSRRIDGVDFSKYESWSQFRNTLGYHLAVYLLQLLCIYLSLKIISYWLEQQ